MDKLDGDDDDGGGGGGDVVADGYDDDDHDHGGDAASVCDLPSTGFLHTRAKRRIWASVTVTRTMTCWKLGGAVYVMRDV